MPLVAIACLCYAAGLFLSQTAPGVVGTAVGLAALLVSGVALAGGLARRHAPVPLCALVAAAGIATGTASRQRDAACIRSSLGKRSLHAWIDADAEPGALVPARVRIEGCTMRALLFVSDGSAAAGSDVTLTGEVSPGARDLVVRDARILGAEAPAGPAAWRARAGRRIDRLFAGDAPLVRALVIADMTAIPAEQRDAFARAGLVHMLSVSGLHVAIVALGLELLARALRIPRGPSGIATMALLSAYVVLIGAPAPAVRAAVMLALGLTTRLLQRPTSRWAIVAVGSAAPLVEPAVVLDIGWQLSVAGTIALVAGAGLARRVLPRACRGTRRRVLTGAIISVVATLVTAPLVAWTFGRLALLGPLTNLLADPVMGALQPLLFLALCLPVAGIARLLADAAHVLIAVFNGIAAAAASVPHGSPAVWPSAFGAVMAGVAAAALVVACLAKRPARALLVGLSALVMCVLEPLLPAHRGATEIHMLDVGQGDALAVRTRGGRWLVVDAGRSWAGSDAGRSIVVPYLAHRGGDVALFLMSHPHADHVGGAASLFDALHPAVFLDPGYAGGSAPYLAALAAARRDAIPWRRVHPGDSLSVDEVVITTLAPDSAWAAGLADANLASAVVMLRVGRVRVLFTGDAEEPEEAWLLARDPAVLAADVLKVAHHGSNTSTSPAFLAAVRPRVALVSVGAHNRYHHPSPDILRALRSAGADVLRTDRLGTVVLRTDGESLEVEARGARWAAPLRVRR